MNMFQILVPFLTVLVIFTAGHFAFPSKGSGIYMPEAEINDLPEDEPDLLAGVDERDIDPATGQVFPDKYNYLKIENVFAGQLVDTDSLFSVELALLTKQPSVSSDLFIAALAEMEADVTAAITPTILEVKTKDLITVEGRTALCEKIRAAVNEYLENEKNMTPAISEVFIINFNIV